MTTAQQTDAPTTPHCGAYPSMDDALLSSNAVAGDEATHVDMPHVDASDAVDAAQAGDDQTPEGYEITLPDGMEGVDELLDQRLQDAGFSQEQAQLVYDLADEVLSPLIADMDQAAKRAADRAELTAEFGGAENWKRLAPKIERWGRANLPEAAFETLCQSADGVRAMHRLMDQNQEAALGQSNGGVDEGDVRSDIRRKMNDPRYWRDRDPGLVAEVQAGFARLSGQ
jgi:hypothetical protein